MKVIGITGGIGSGKTTVCKVFEVLGIPVFYADDVSKKILFSAVITDQVISRFGSEVTLDGVLNKKKLANYVFSNPLELKWLESVLHPAVALEFENWTKIQTSRYVLKEAAILFESGSYKSCDAVLNVSCSEAERLKRVMKRDGKTKVEVESVMQKQWTEVERKEVSDYLIFNENQKLFPQIIKLHQEFLSL